MGTDSKNSSPKPFSQNPNVMYVVDGVPMEVEQIKADEILEESVLAGKQLESMFEHSQAYFERKIDTLILILTKKGGIAIYQRTFGLASGRYRRYLGSHDNNDQSVLYVLNGTPLENGKKETIKKLCDIHKDSLSSVKFIPNIVKKHVYVNRGNSSALIIQTKGQ